MPSSLTLRPLTADEADAVRRLAQSRAAAARAVERARIVWYAHEGECVRASRCGGERVFVGNATEWEPPRRFDYARTELVYVPRPRQQGLVARLLHRVVAPGGRLIVCANRPRGARDAEPIGELLRGWGFAVAGEAAATDPTGGGVATRVVWIDVPC